MEVSADLHPAYPRLSAHSAEVIWVNSTLPKVATGILVILEVEAC